MPIGLDLQSLAEGSLDRRRRWFGEDICDLVGPVFTEGGASGDSVALGPVASGIECFIEELSAGDAQTVIGGEAFVSSHKIEVKRTATTLAITPRYKIKVRARDGVSERVFEKPVRTSQSFMPLLVFKCTLVKQGYQ